MGSKPETRSASSEVKLVLPTAHSILGIPQFSDMRPSSWFAIFESELINKQFFSDEQKYHQLIPRLPKAMLQIIEHILLDPPKENKYDTVKRLILQETQSSVKSTLDQLCDRSELGDKKPSALLREMRITAAKNVSDELLRELWLRRLPHYVQAMLTMAVNQSLSELATTADSILERVPWSHISPIPQPFVNSCARPSIETEEVNALRREVESLRVSNTRDERQELLQEIATLKKDLAEVRQARPPRQLSPRRRYPASPLRAATPDPSLCWYHQEFGRNAKRCRPPCSWQKPGSTGNLGHRNVFATRVSDGAPVGHLFYVQDQLSNLRFLVDTGAEVSVISPSHQEKQRTPTTGLRAANGTPIATYGQRSITIDLGLQRTFRWVFLVADVPFAILGIDFLRHFDLLVDTRRRLLLASGTNLGVRGTPTSTPAISPVFITPASSGEAQPFLFSSSNETELSHRLSPTRVYGPWASYSCIHLLNLLNQLAQNLPVHLVQFQHPRGLLLKRKDLRITVAHYLLS